MCLLVKQTTYVNRCMKQNTTMEEILSKFHRIESYELYNARKKEKTKSFRLCIKLKTAN